MTHYLQEELTSFWSRLTPYLAILESKSPQEGAVDPVGRITVDTEDRQAFALHITDQKPHGDTSDIPTGHSATYMRFKSSGADWGPWQREEY
ncbi:hypothetical protein [Paraburkholderia fynbosensis]|uniref:Uncharacterized protein n=1 Tax=Paraburkholderia fynbosensis TaxID=1200993 RepID=A0A6J5GKY1_9BURK|nr:hypothetical protein [Paraburkholderia fynbosensis]CAB3800933.1 hypothetical protein LMG27177_04918 [Paraburkholderia fynbosensis]